MYKNEKTSNKAVIYCRVSTPEQVKGESLDGQKRQCINFAEKNSYAIVKEFIEKGETAKTTHRTALRNLMAFCFDKRNDVAAVICLKQDRMFRNLLDERQLEKAFNKIGIRILYVNGNNDNSATARLHRNINGSFSEWESEVNGERTKAGNTQCFLNGRYIKQLKGYSFGTNAMGKRQIYPNEDAKYIKKAFQLMATGVYKQREVMRMLQAEGFKTYPQAFGRIFDNTVYCGWLPDTQKVNGGQAVKGIHEPLVSEEEFSKVQEIRHGKRPNAIPRDRNNPMFPLRRYVRCLECKELMTASRSKGKSGHIAYYHCSKCRSSKASRVMKKVLEPAFIDYLIGLSLSEKQINNFEKYVINAFNSQTKDIKNLHRIVGAEIKKLEEDKSRLIKLLANGTIEAADVKPEIERIKGEIDEKRLLIADSEDTPDIAKCWEFVKYFINNLAKIWDRADLDLRQRLQGLITPEGFYFEEKLIKPHKNPHFISIFSSKMGNYKSMGG